MCQLIETIKCKDGKLENMFFHQQRFLNSRFKCFDTENNISLNDVIHIPDSCQSGLYRCRVIYSKKIEKIEFLKHSFRNVNSLKIVYCDTIEYEVKRADRDQLFRLFKERGECDDILIVKNGHITDSYTANVIFYDGEEWWSSDTPLLKGTQRERLLNEGKVKVCKITLSDLKYFKKAGLINAMQDMQDMQIVPIDKIVK